MAKERRLTRDQEKILQAVRRDDADGLRALLRRGAKPVFGHGHETTPLHEAVDRGMLNLVDLLLAYGAAPDLRSLNDEKLTPLDIARNYKNEALVLTLVRRGAPTAAGVLGSPDDPAIRAAATDKTFKKITRKAAPKKTKAPPKDTTPPTRKKKPRKKWNARRLKKEFDAAAWRGRPDEMVKAWENVPASVRERLSKKFDFAAQLTRVNQQNIRDNKPQNNNLGRKPI